MNLYKEHQYISTLFTQNKEKIKQKSRVLLLLLFLLMMVPSIFCYFGLIFIFTRKINRCQVCEARTVKRLYLCGSIKCFVTWILLNFSCQKNRGYLSTSVSETTPWEIGHLKQQRKLAEETSIPGTKLQKSHPYSYITSRTFLRDDEDNRNKINNFSFIFFFVVVFSSGETQVLKFEDKLKFSLWLLLSIDIRFQAIKCWWIFFSKDDWQV